MPKLIIITPKAEHTSKVEAAIAYLKKHAPKYYLKLSSLKKIRIKNTIGYYNELFPAKRIWISELSVITKNTTVYLASLILHEVHHLVQFDRGVRNIDGRAERGAYKAQYDFLMHIGRQKDAEGIMEVYKQVHQKKK